MLRRISAMTLAVTALSIMGVQAQAQTVTTKLFVSQKNLDVSNPADARTDYERSQIASAQVCGGTTSDFPADRPDQLLNCYQPTSASAALAAAGANAPAPLTTLRPPATGDVGLPTVTRARFKIEGVSIKALDETGWDWLGHDEVIAIFQSDGHEVHTGIYDMNSGDTDNLRDGQSCISPFVDNDGKSNHRWSCNEDGRPGGADFRVILYEYDGVVRGFGGFCVGGTAINDIETPDCYDWYDSTEIGRRHVVLSEAELLSHLSKPGDEVAASVPINICSKYEQPGVTNTCVYNPNGGDYVFNFKITRTADETVPSLHPEATPH